MTRVSIARTFTFIRPMLASVMTMSLRPPNGDASNKAQRGQEAPTRHYLRCESIKPFRAPRETHIEKRGALLTATHGRGQYHASPTMTRRGCRRSPFGYITHHNGNWVIVGDAWYWARRCAVEGRVPLLDVGWSRGCPEGFLWIHSGDNVRWCLLPL